MKGTHGTCSSLADKIIAGKFIPSEIGLKGSGVYCWSYENDDQFKEYAKALAVAWWRFSDIERGTYNECSDKTCVVLHVQLHTCGGLFLDLEGRDLKDRMEVFVDDVHARLIKNPSGNLRERFSKACDLFIELLEEELGNKADIVHVTVSLSDRFWKVMGSGIRGFPLCYIVKNVDCIQVTYADRSIQ